MFSIPLDVVFSDVKVYAVPRPDDYKVFLNKLDVS